MMGADGRLKAFREERRELEARKGPGCRAPDGVYWMRLKRLRWLNAQIGEFLDERKADRVEARAEKRDKQKEPSDGE